VLQDVGIIVSGIAENNHIISVFLSQNYPWDNKHTDAFSVPSELFKWIQIVLFHIIKWGTSPLSMDPGLTTSPNQLPDLTDIILTMYIDVN